MGKIVIRDNSAGSAEAKVEAKPKKTKSKAEMKPSTAVKPKAETKSEKLKKAKSTVTPGSELVLAPARAVVVAKKKPASAKAGAGKKKTVNVDGVISDGSKKPAGGEAAKAGAKKGGESVATKKATKSLSGMVIDSTVKPSETETKVDAEADGYVVEEPKVGEDVKAKKDEEPTKKPRFSKPKSMLIGAGVALGVALVGFLGIWFFSRKPVEKCVVRFEPNGGTQVNAQSVVCGTFIEEPEEPTKDGFDFKGWIFEGLEFDFQGNPVTTNMILTARWEARPGTETVRVSFDTDGGSALESIEVKKGGVLPTVATVPTKYGYTFAGWYLDDEPFDFSQEINENLTLVAHWKEKPQSASGDGGGNSSSGNSNSGGGTSSGKDEPTVSAGSCDPLKRGDVQGVTVEVGSTTKVASTMAYLAVTNCNVSYRTSDTVKIELSGSTVKGLTAGEAKVAVCLSELDGKEVECTDIPVQVKEKVVEPEIVNVSGVEIVEGSKTNLTEGEEVQLYEKVLPSNATDKAATWSSSDSAVVTVTADGLMKAVGVGTATLTVTTRDGGKTASIKVTVTCKNGYEIDEELGVCVEKTSETGGNEIGGGTQTD